VFRHLLRHSTCTWRCVPVQWQGEIKGGVSPKQIRQTGRASGFESDGVVGLGTGYDGVAEELVAVVVEDLVVVVEELVVVVEELEEVGGIRGGIGTVHSTDAKMSSTERSSDCAEMDTVSSFSLSSSREGWEEGGEGKEELPVANRLSRCSRS